MAAKALRFDDELLADGGHLDFPNAINADQIIDLAIQSAGNDPLGDYRPYTVQITEFFLGGGVEVDRFFQCRGLILGDLLRRGNAALEFAGFFANVDGEASARCAEAGNSFARLRLPSNPLVPSATSADASSSSTCFRHASIVECASSSPRFFASGRVARSFLKGLSLSR